MIGKIKAYYQLTKPGIIYGNTLTAAAGFLLASAHFKQFDPWLGLATLVSIALIMASGCVFNNYIDRGIDKKMARTKKRALVDGTITGRNALIYATVLGVFGFALIAYTTNMLTTALGVVALIMYVIVYGFAKRQSAWGTIVGSVSGALPPVAGYTAVSGQLDAGAIILFLILTFWQMPHFYAIAMYRRDDYAAAGIPVLPIKRGMRATKIQMIWFVLGFIAATASLTLFDYTGITYVVIMIILGLRWLTLGIQGFKKDTDDVRWARKMFFFSLIILLALSVIMPLGAILP
ncbi:MAG: heme o synthase [Candidatus Saccharimonadales bacterium]